VSEYPVVSWTEDDEARSARWRSESAAPPPKRVVIADDRMTADAAYRLACEGTALLWRGDFQNARQLLQALARRVERKPRRADRKPPKPVSSPTEAFHLHRLAQSQRARTLGMLLIPLDEDYSIPLRRATDVRQACLEAYGPGDGPSVASLRELLGLIGAHEWRKKGVDIPALGARIHPHYGVFAPVRGEYVGLVNEAPLPSRALAFDIGTGTGVLAAVLARRGVAHVVATDQDPRALACARDNIARLGLSGQVEVVQADLFPAGRAPLIVCNPPWVPARPSSPLEHAVYDPDSRMLRGFLSGLAAHLEPGGEGWLLLSDLAEHLGLRTRAELLAAIDAAGLKVVDRMDVRPSHPKASDVEDPLHAARAAEVTSLWRLAVR
jgi:methylase of polypeptide subunit release factors